MDTFEVKQVQDIKTNEIKNQENQNIKLVQNQEQNKQEETILSKTEYKKILETLLFITDRPLSASKLNQISEIGDLSLTRSLITEIQEDYINMGSAIQVVEIGGGFQMSTKAEYGRWVRKLYNEKMSMRLSPAALETLAIIAYKQPITRAEIESIRGVDVSGPLEKILGRGLIKIAGKREAPGRPMVYATTDEFLRVFGLNHINDLPEMKTFSTKTFKDIQSDLPFAEQLPPEKEKILPLTEEENLPLYPKETDEQVKQTEEVKQEENKEDVKPTLPEDKGDNK